MLLQRDAFSFTELFGFKHGWSGGAVFDVCATYTYMDVTRLVFALVAK